MEAAVVVYLRTIAYPAGFSFPLQSFAAHLLRIEVGREAATLVILLALALISGRTRWSRFGAFVIAMGAWDITYYVWLRLFLAWPASLLDPDVLFLIPVPWVGPVLAPILVSVLLILSGILLLREEEAGRMIKPPLSAWLTAAGGSVIILYTFMSGSGETMRGGMPAPYSYTIFSIGFACLAASLAITFWPASLRKSSR